jgi:hypothetical protein
VQLLRLVAVVKQREMTHKHVFFGPKSLKYELKTGRKSIAVNREKLVLKTGQ